MVTRPAEDEVRPWERQPGETARQFAYFRYYRDLPAEQRTIPGGVGEVPRAPG